MEVDVDVAVDVDVDGRRRCSGCVSKLVVTFINERAAQRSHTSYAAAAAVSADKSEILPRAYRTKTQKAIHNDNQQQEQQLLSDCSLPFPPTTVTRLPTNTAHALSLTCSLSLSPSFWKADVMLARALPHLHLFARVCVWVWVCIGVVLIKATNALFFQIQHKMKLKRECSKKNLVGCAMCALLRNHF